MYTIGRFWNDIHLFHQIDMLSFFRKKKVLSLTAKTHPIF